MAHDLHTRDIIGAVTSAPETFTSWDKCMNKSYCKWPVIVGIVIGSLILLSVLWCFVRCLCCGAELCSCCCSCCPSGRGRGRSTKHQDDYSRMPPTPYSGYQPAPAPMAYGNPNIPQFATFDNSSAKVNEDSLPPMPSWDNAATKRVEDHSQPAHQTANGDLEMGRLDTQLPQRMRGGYNSVPNGPISPVSPNPQAEYFTNTGMSHSYNSDLGAQRINPTGQGYDNFDAVPLSPPPTYRSNSNTHSLASDRFLVGAASPSPNDYNRQQHQQQSFEYQQPTSYAPSAPSTRYEPSDADYSSNTMNMHSPYNGQPDRDQHYQARPPSFLQVGRKPVTGSFREI